MRPTLEEGSPTSQWEGGSFPEAPSPFTASQKLYVLLEETRLLKGVTLAQEPPLQKEPLFPKELPFAIRSLNLLIGLSLLS